MIQPNLRMTDAVGLDGKKLVRQVRSYGANAMLANGGGIVAWYPTKLPYQYRNPLLKGDFVGDVVAETRKLGMKVLFRMDWSGLLPHIGRKHRDWLALDAEGKPILEWKGTKNPLMSTCPSRPYWQEYGPRELEELMSRHHIDGFFFNAWNLPDCRCPECQRDCKSALGEKMPRHVDWSSKFGRALLIWRCRKHADFTRRLNDRIKAFSPDTLLTVDYHLTNDHAMLGLAAWDATMLTKAVDMVTVEAFNFLSRSRPHWPYWAAESAKMARNFGNDVPGLVLLSGSERGIGRRPAQPPAQMELNIRQIVENGGNPCFAMSGDFRQDDRKCLPVVKRVFRELERSRPPSVRRAVTALVYPQRTLDMAVKDPRGTALLEYRGWYEALDSMGAGFTVVHDGSLAQYLAGSPGIKTLVLPNVACLSMETCRAVDEWVRKGGKLVATFESSRCDDLGSRRPGFGLMSIKGRPGNKISIPGTWYQVEQTGRKYVGNHTGIFPASGEFLMMHGGGSGALRLMGWNFNNKPEWAQPEGTTNQLGLYDRRMGRGRVIYLPWKLGKLLHLNGSGEHRDLMMRLVSVGVRA